MEDPQELQDAVLAFARELPGIDAVILTGSRARPEGPGAPDEYSDIDIELIGPGALALAGDAEWPARIAPVLVALPLRNGTGAPGEPEWPTCLVVFARGRGVDITLAGPERLEALAREGLDDTYARGYRVLWDPRGAAAALPAPRGVAAPAPPTDAEFEANQRGFWYEATQIPIYIARGDLWPVRTRDATMKALLLEMFRWRAVAEDPERETWYGGRELHEWIPATHFAALAEAHSGFSGRDSLAALRSTIDLYVQASEDAARLTGRETLGGLRAPVVSHINRLLGR